jgi:ABC-type branched-subunit amino acid transport system ATPase component
LAASVRKQSVERRHRQAGQAEPAADEPAQVSFPRPPAPVGAPGAAGEVVLEARDVIVDFGGLRAVNEASITVPSGRIVGLIGPNGAGKTTLFNAITGAIRPRSGRVFLGGHDITGLPTHARAQRGLGRTFQLVGLARDRSVTENLLLAQHQLAVYTSFEAIGGFGRAPATEQELRGRAAEALTTLGFERDADTPVAELSGGQQRIVEIACALLTAPRLLMLDEPSAGMAPVAVESLGERLAELRDDAGRTILLIEHNIPLVLDVCDDIYVMSEGAVIAHGPPRAVVAMDSVVEAYLGRVEV